MGCLMLRARRANLCTYRETGLPAPARKGVFARCPSTKRWHAFRSLIYIKRSKGEVSAGRCEGASLLVNRPVPRSGKQGVRPRRVSAFDPLGRARGRRSTCRTCASRSSVLSNVVAQLIPQEVSALQLASNTAGIEFCALARRPTTRIGGLHIRLVLLSRCNKDGPTASDSIQSFVGQFTNFVSLWHATSPVPVAMHHCFAE